MKWLLFLLILLSVCVGIKSNVGWIALWGSEFQSALYAMAHGKMTTWLLVKWLLLIVAHAGVFILPFIVGKRYFWDVLVIAPASFILLFMLWDLLTAFFLIPFIIVWIICMVNSYKPTI